MEKERDSIVKRRKATKATCLELAATAAGGDEASEDLYLGHVVQRLRGMGNPEVARIVEQFDVMYADF